MRNMKLAIVLVAALLAGCNDVVSLAPLYDEATLTFEPRLLGTWRVDKNETWTFTAAGRQMYRMVDKEIEETEDGKEPRVKETNFDAGVVNLSGRLFLDLISEDSGPTGAPAHIFARIEIENDVLHVGWLDPSWMKEKLKRDTYLTSTAGAHDKTILTSPTRDLQFFFRSYAWDDEAFLDGKGRHPDSINTFFPRIP